MIAVDTNVLVRILVDDPRDTKQVALARAAVQKHSIVFIPQIVQIELVWVLKAAYELEKTEIISVLQHLHENEAFHLQRFKQFEEALHLYQTTNADFSDCLIQVESKEVDCAILTFDRKFAILTSVMDKKLVKPAPIQQILR